MFHPFKVPGLLMRMFPHLVWRGNPLSNSIYLTFDDGPHPAITPWVLEQLAAYGASATFFCVGENVQRFPETVRLIVEQGHRLGNHTHRHLKGWKTADDVYIKDIETCAQLIPTDLFRPPYGRIRNSQAKTITAKGYRIIMWSLLSCDYDPDLPWKKSLKSLISNTKPGSIIVFHDSSKAEHNLKQILPQYLRAMAERGFNFKHL